MAQIYPDIKNINKLKVRPTSGECQLLNFLIKNLSNDFEVYFQPYINGDRPDIVIVKKNSGVLIIEVKDWNLGSYEIDSNKNWYLKKIQNNRGQKQIIKSPISQVKEYKNNLYNLHIENLLERKINDPKYFSIVNCAVYFSNATKNEINIFFEKEFKTENQDLKYIDLLGKDDLTLEKFNKVLSKRRLNTKSHLFDEELYNSFKRFFQPPIHTLEEGTEIKYSPKQTELSQSMVVQQKIKGFAGSGKTILLAKRAVNSHKRTSSKVLILTYNISLKNYIHDKISDVREEFEWKYFNISNYHQFINSETNNLNICIKKLESYEDLNLFNGYENQIEKYKTILIDEVQDYRTQWIQILKKYFLDEDGEFVVFGDEKQNIYKRILDQDKKPNTTIPGRWIELKESFRLSEKIIHLSTRFQKYFFKEKYDLDVTENIEQHTLFSEENIKHYFFKKKELLPIISQISKIIKEKKIHPNNICFLSSKKEILRDIDFEIRNSFKEHTKTTFATKERFESLKKENDINFKKVLKGIDKNKKFNFWMNDGTMKLSTIHSFKGWEIPTLFLIINNNDDVDELIYTAITRCRYNLFIINIGNQKYYDFFEKNKDLLN